MGRIFLVRIDLPALKAHLEREDRHPYAPDGVLQWLADAGFEQVAPGQWKVDETHLGHLDPSEVLHAELVENH
jgi:hypothetical protein